MANDTSNLEVLSTRSGFNSAVRQIKKTIGISEELGASNLGDVLFELGDEELSGDRIAMFLRMLLVDKLGYRTVSSNLASVVDDPSALAPEFETWKGVDLIAAYHHPELGLLIANPKMAEELAGFGQLRKRELMVIYAGKLGKGSDASCQQAAELALNLFQGAKVKAPAGLLKGNFTVRKLSKAKGNAEDTPVKAKSRNGAAPKKAKMPKPKAGPEAHRVAAPVVTASAASVPAAKGPAKMTPRYAVVVQNELFHNGNVEAWKRIVASYKAKHPALEVFIYYDGERILDINSLFKWGKVKHGSAIEFAVAGNEIQDVAKLQRYLAQGASHQFEAFLRGPVNNVLKLF
ncbi:hypothetical protein AGMMS50293_22300 [Spirochaetia bacterium]|nr:hypothetical protein AGMMS50293_22300 [Spirochaetia bacterium]